MTWGLNEELYGLMPWGVDWEASNKLTITLPEFDISATSSGNLSFDFILEAAFSSSFVSNGLLDISLPDFEFYFYSKLPTAGQLAFNHPLFDISLHGAESPTGRFDIDFIYEFNLVSSYASHIALLYNLNTMQGPFQFTNYNFDSIVYHDGAMYLANSTGLYKVEGLRDISTNIDATMIIPEDDFGDENLKSIVDLYIGMQGGPLLIQTFHDNNYSSQLPFITATDFVTRRTKHPRGDKHRYWGVKLTNSAGASATIDKIFIPFRILPRKISQ